MQATWDVFISYSSKDGTVVRSLAERLRADGLRVWFDQWEIAVGDSIPAKIEEGLEHSRVLLLCMSANAFGSDWARLESGTFRFRDPLNKDRRFVPLRLDNSPLPGSLGQFRYVDWREANRAGEYEALLAVSRPAALVPKFPDEAVASELEVRTMSLGHTAPVRCVAFSPDGRLVVAGADDNTLRLWELDSARCLKILEGHTDRVWSVAMSPDGKRAVSGAADGTLRLWDVESARCLKILEGHSARVLSVAIGPDGKRAVSGADDNTLRLWDLESAHCLKILEGHTASVLCVALSPDGGRILSGAADKTLRLWDLESARCLKVLKGHTNSAWSVAFTPDGKRAVSGAADKTLRLWDVESARCLKILEGHADRVWSVAISPDGKLAISGAADNTIRLWDLDFARCLKALEGHTDRVWSVAISPDGKLALSGSADKTLRLWDLESARCLKILGGHTARVLSVAIDADGKLALSGSADKTLRLWDVQSARCLKVLEGHTDRVWSVAMNPDRKRAVSGSADGTLRFWDLESVRCLQTLVGHAARVWAVAMSPDGGRVVSGADDKTVRLWDLESARCLKILEGHTGSVLSLAVAPHGKWAVSGSADNTLRLWDLQSARCLKVLEGHTGGVLAVAISPDGKWAVSGSADKTVRLWDLDSARCLKVLESHTASVWSVAFSPDGKRAISGSADNTLRLWDLESAGCLKVLEGHASRAVSVVFSPDGRLFSGAYNGVLRIWNRVVALTSPPAAAGLATKEVPYSNAKVLLVGDSGVGKTGLARYLGSRIKDKGDNPSTDGAWATHWPLAQGKQTGVDREILLWDFAGQVDYRLVHQLYMDNTATAVLVFNPQNENLFEGLGQWDRDLHKATHGKFAKLLAAGRVDRGGLVVSSESIKRFMAERGFQGDLHLTSAMTGQGCDELGMAIADAIDWDSLAVTSSPRLYRRMKEEILHLRDSGIVLLRLAELKQRMELALQGESFDPAELETVVGLLAGPGLIRRVGFGGFILLRPEVLSRYAAALIRKVRSHPQELGCIREDDLLSGALDYQDFQRLPPEDEIVVLRDLHEIFVSRAWCLRQPSDQGAMLTFPSYFRRERPEKPTDPSILVTYRFSGPAEEIYSTLVVRLHHTTAFETAALWRSAADFKTQTGKRLGVLFIRDPEGSARLDAYFEPDVDETSRVLFLRYVDDHLRRQARDVVRLRHYACTNRKCDSWKQPFSDQGKIDKALAPGGKGKVFCPDCGTAIELRDTIDARFNSDEVKEQARKEGDTGDFKIDNESRELILVGHAYAIAGEAGQIFRGYTNSDHGIDGEIEFKDDHGHATGKRVYLQLKSGDSYLTHRKRDDAEVFQIKNPRWATYWQEQAYPVMLVIRTSDGAIRWMDASEYLRRETRADEPVTQIEFEGERLDVMALRRYRDRVLGSQTGGEARRRRCQEVITDALEDEERLRDDARLLLRIASEFSEDHFRLLLSAEAPVEEREMRDEARSPVLLTALVCNRMSDLDRNRSRELVFDFEREGLLSRDASKLMPSLGQAPSNSILSERGRILLKMAHGLMNA